MRTSVCVLMIGLFTSIAFGAGESFFWIKSERLPMHIMKGEYSGKGMYDKIINLINENSLQGFDVRYKQMSNQQAMELKATNCFIGGKDKAGKRVFSAPLFFWPSAGVITHKRNKKVFGKKGTMLSLETLLKNKALKLGAVGNFTYSKNIMAVLNKYKAAKNIQWSTGMIQEVSLSKLDRKRVDYILGWSTQPLADEKVNKKKNNYLFYPLKEGQIFFNVGVSCSNNKVGKMVVERVNVLIKDRKMKRKMLNNIEYWSYLPTEWYRLYEKVMIEGEKDSKIVDME